MNAQEAKTVVLDEQHALFGRLALPANIRSSQENDDRGSLLDLVECLKRGNLFNKVTIVDEVAALALHRRTGRARRPGPLPYEDFLLTGGK